MRLNPYCMCCAVNKQEQKIRCFTDMEKKTEYMKKVMGVLAAAGPDDCAPSISIKLKKLYSQYWNPQAALSEEGIFSQIKHEFNQLMLSIEHQLKENIRRATDPLEAALLYARIGNYIDFAALSNVDKNEVLSMIEEENKEPLDQAEYRNFRRDLDTAASLVYLTDNCGEIVLDKLVIKILKEQYPHLDITVVVRGYPVSNDATMEDAAEAGMTSVARVIGNGSDVAGTWYPGISQETKDLLESADLIIAKGQGNFETLHQCGLNIYYLFLCKCQWFQTLFNAKPLQGMFVNERR
ncbi:MAG: ARMT1-like domain-containing protein [Eubacteriales bacterium]|nr:ARMT1-like domain-containing protein [Eubacteriales bacterium]